MLNAQLTRENGFAWVSAAMGLRQTRLAACIFADIAHDMPIVVECA